jgi:hypothetical protein
VRADDAAVAADEDADRYDAEDDDGRPVPV